MINIGEHLFISLTLAMISLVMTDRIMIFHNEFFHFSLSCLDHIDSWPERLADHRVKGCRLCNDFPISSRR